MAQQSGNDLKPLLEKLLQAFDDEDDRDLLHRTELDHIFRILRANKDKITSRPPDVEKKEELPELLRKIDEALQQCKARSKQPQQSDNAKSKKMALPSVSDCNPFKSRSPEFSVEPLLQQTINILGDAPSTPAPAANHDAAGEDTVLYEWTTSYVDEDRIYGWADEADKVVDALVGLQEEGKEDQLLFRAAGITGIHGSGKTALAQKVFVHDRIKDAFPLRLWVCVGPPDHEDRFNLLYRMLDNLGLDTAKVEAIVDNADVVKAAGDKDKSKIGVLLFILYVTLYKTGYLIVFDDIRAYPGSDGWYSNLTLQPPKNGEWYERLAYGLPKARKSAVLVTCRSEDDARTMVRTGRVFRPPGLGDAEGWKLFEREYNEAEKKSKKEKEDDKDKDEKKEEDKLYKELEQMKEQIVGKCLRLPVAIVQAAKGFALLAHKPDDPPKSEDKALLDGTVPSKTDPATEATEANQPVN
ncbi:hypothetical protein ACQ4PT_069395 [Festuca glaucescens]